jgi:hypothetical protein
MPPHAPLLSYMDMLECQPCGETIFPCQTRYEKAHPARGLPRRSFASASAIHGGPFLQSLLSARTAQRFGTAVEVKPTAFYTNRWRRPAMSKRTLADVYREAATALTLLPLDDASLTPSPAPTASTHSVPPSKSKPPRSTPTPPQNFSPPQTS